MATGKQDYSTTNAITFLSTEMGGLADGAYTSAGSEIDLGDPSPFEIAVNARLIAQGSTATGSVLLYALFSNTTGAGFPTQASGTNNGILVGSVDLNTAGAFNNTFKMEVQARYVKMMAYNDSGGSLSTTNSIIYGTDVFVDGT